MGQDLATTLDPVLTIHRAPSTLALATTLVLDLTTLALATTLVPDLTTLDLVPTTLDIEVLVPTILLALITLDLAIILVLVLITHLGPTTQALAITLVLDLAPTTLVLITLDLAISLVLALTTLDLAPIQALVLTILQAHIILVVPTSQSLDLVSSTLYQYQNRDQALLI